MYLLLNTTFWHFVIKKLIKFTVKTKPHMVLPTAIGKMIFYYYCN